MAFFFKAGMALLSLTFDTSSLPCLLPKGEFHKEAQFNLVPCPQEAPLSDSAHTKITHFSGISRNHKPSELWPEQKAAGKFCWGKKHSPCLWMECGLRCRCDIGVGEGLFHPGEQTESSNNALCVPTTDWSWAWNLSRAWESQHHCAAEQSKWRKGPVPLAM